MEINDFRWGHSSLALAFQAPRPRRVRVNLPVQMSANAEAGADGCIKNLSLSGALVKTDVDLGLHALSQVRINRPRPSQRVAAITAYISRKTKEGIGVEWCEFAPSALGGPI
jgi:hypothetical protein